MHPMTMSESSPAVLGDAPIDESREQPSGVPTEAVPREGEENTAAFSEGANSASLAPDDDGSGGQEHDVVDDVDGEGEDEDAKSMASASHAMDDEEIEDEEMEEDSEETGSVADSGAAEPEAENANAGVNAKAPNEAPAVDAPIKKKRGKPQIPASARKGRAPAVKGLNIPFRTVKKARTTMHAHGVWNAAVFAGSRRILSRRGSRETSFCSLTRAHVFS